MYDVLYDVTMIGAMVLFAAGYGAIGLRAARGKASPRNYALRAPSKTTRDGRPVPSTWHCEHTWRLTQQMSAPYFLGQAVMLVLAAGFAEGLRLVEVAPRVGFPLVFSACAAASYLGFGFAAGRRTRALAALRCAHFDGGDPRWVDLPPRRVRLPARPVAPPVRLEDAVSPATAHGSSTLAAMSAASAAVAAATATLAAARGGTRAPAACTPEPDAEPAIVLPEAMPREAMPREAMPREAMPREAMPREAMPREAMPREAMPREAEAGEVSAAGRAAVS